MTTRTCFWISLLLLALTATVVACNEAPQSNKAPTTAPQASTASANNLVTTNFHAEGMHCGACEAAIDKAVRALDGVSEVAADYTTLTVAVTYDAATVAPEAIIAAIEPLGYKASLAETTADPGTAPDGTSPAATAAAENAAAQGAEGENCNTCADAKAVEQLPAEVPVGMTRTSFSVTGMGCPGKAGRVTKALLVLEGISGCAADAATTTVTVDYDPQVIQPQAILMAIKGAGFEAIEQVKPS